MLCAMVFEHPAGFPPLGTVGDRDIRVPLNVVENRALVGALQFEPPGGLVTLDPGVREIGVPRRHMIIRFTDVTTPEVSEVTVRVVLGLGPRVEAWPPMSYLNVWLPHLEGDVPERPSPSG
jgi:hypothetical protein